MSGMTRAKVGFGDDYSRTRATSTMNAFVRVETRPVAGGADVVVGVRRDYFIAPEIDVYGDEVVIHLRKDYGPRVGERVTIRGRLVKVAERRYDPTGRLMLLDEDTRVWLYAGEA